MRPLDARVAASHDGVLLPRSAELSALEVEKFPQVVERTARCLAVSGRDLLKYKTVQGGEYQIHQPVADIEATVLELVTQRPPVFGVQLLDMDL